MLRFSRISKYLAVYFVEFEYICFVKLFLQITFILIILGGSLGIPVYQHTCLTNNSTDQTLFVDATVCHDDEQTHDEMDCCSSQKEETKKDDGCCTDDVSAYKVSFFKQFQSEFQFSTIDFNPNVKAVYFNETVQAVSKKEVLAFADLPPPKLQKRLALIQVWRI